MRYLVIFYAEYNGSPVTYSRAYQAESEQDAISQAVAAIRKSFSEQEIEEEVTEDFFQAIPIPDEIDYVLFEELIFGDG